MSVQTKKGTQASERLPGGAVVQGVSMDRGVNVYDGKSNVAPYSKAKADRSARSKAAKSMRKGN